MPTSVRANALALPKSNRRTKVLPCDFDPAHFVHDPSALPERYALRVRGDCLAPEIADGVRVLIDRTVAYVPGDMVVIWRRREATPSGQCQALLKKLVMAPPPWVTRFPFSEHPDSGLASLICVGTTNPPACFAFRCCDLLAVHHCLGLAHHRGRPAFSRRASGQIVHLIEAKGP